MAPSVLCENLPLVFRGNSPGSDPDRIELSGLRQQVRFQTLTRDYTWIHMERDRFFPAPDAILLPPCICSDLT